jgi:HK97 family phage major capsid protein
MTRKDELMQDISAKRTRITELNKLVETEKRVKTEVERQEIDGLFTSVENLEKEVQDLERSEKIKIEAPTVITSERKEKNRKYDLSKAVSEGNERGLSGLEAEMDQEVRRNYPQADKRAILIPDAVIYRAETMVNSAGLISSEVSGLDIIKVPGQYEKWGSTVFNNLTGYYKLNYSDGAISDKKAEGEALSTHSYTKSNDELKPNRFGHIVICSEEALASTSMLASSIQDADSSIDAEISAYILAGILANTGTTLSGYASSETAKLLTSKDVTKLKSALLSAMFRKPAYVAGASLYGELEETTGATIMKTIIDNMKIKGYNVYDVMNLLEVHDTNKYDLIFGDWSRSYVGKWGNAMQILVNPYSSDTTSEIRLRFSRLADTAFNPYAFKAIRNAKIS